MAHARKQIREAVKTAITGLTTTGARVYESRVYPMAADNLPGLIVYTIQEAAEPISRLSSGVKYMRTLNIAVEAYVKATGTADDTIDQICAEVEAALPDAAGVLALVEKIDYIGTEIDFFASAEKPAFAATMTYQAVYYTLENDAETILN